MIGARRSDAEMGCTLQKTSPRRVADHGAGKGKLCHRRPLEHRTTLLGLRRGQGSTWGTRLSVAGGRQRGRVCTQPHPAGWAWGGRRRTAARVGSPFRSRRGLVGRMGIKRPETGSKRRFLGEYATWPITAQLPFENRVMSRVASTRVPRECKYSVNPPASVQRVPCPRPRPRLAVGSVIGIPRRNLTMRRGYDVSGAGTSSSHPHARLCSGLRFHGRNRSTSSTARPPAWAHASR